MKNRSNCRFMRNCGGIDYVRSGVVTWAHTKLIILFIRLLIFPTENTPTINLQKRICEVFWVRKDCKRKEKEGKFLQFRWSFSGVYHEYTVTADDVKRLLRSSVKTQPDLSCFVQLWFSSDVKASSSFIFSVSTKNSR